MKKTFLNEIIMSDNPLFNYNNLIILVPELRDCVKCNQNKYHSKNVFGHIMDVVMSCEKDLILKLAALFHDIGKPKVKTYHCPDCDKKYLDRPFHCGKKFDDINCHFYQHEVESGKMIQKIMERLEYNENIIYNVRILVEDHMFPFDMNKKTVKKLIKRVGKNNIVNLIKLRIADIMGSKNDSISDLKKTRKMLDIMSEIIEEDESFTIKDLAINGKDVIEILNIKPSKIVGEILKTLLEEVKNNPEKNNRECLLEMICLYDQTYK